MSEAQLWRTVSQKLGPYGKLRRIEDKLSRGTPDVLYYLRRGNVSARGFIELKHLPSWPSRATTPIIIPHLTIEQIIFGIEEEALDGHYGCILQIDRTYMLLSAAVLGEVHARKYNAAALRAAARVVGEGSFPTLPILKYLVMRDTTPERTAQVAVQSLQPEYDPSL